MNICAKGNCLLSVNQKDYKTSSFIRKWISDGINVATSQDIVFIDASGSTTVCLEANKTKS